MHQSKVSPLLNHNTTTVTCYATLQILSTTNYNMHPHVHLYSHAVSVSSGIALPPLADHVEKTCIMSKLGQCVLTKYKNKKVDWVKCDQCHSWYHCVCVGVCQQVCRTINFICCSDEATNPELAKIDELCGLLVNAFVYYRVFNWPWPTRGKSSLLMLRDIKSIYPGNGLSDAVIDFYAR